MSQREHEKENSFTVITKKTQKKRRSHRRRGAQALLQQVVLGEHGGEAVGERAERDRDGDEGGEVERA